MTYSWQKLLNKRQIVFLEAAIEILKNEKCSENSIIRMNAAAQVLIPEQPPTIEDRIQRFWIQHGWRGSRGVLSRNMRMARASSQSIIRKKLLWNLRMHNWFPFLFKWWR